MKTYKEVTLTKYVSVTHSLTIFFTYCVIYHWKISGYKNL